jgi:hypothetical protein
MTQGLRALFFASRLDLYQHPVPSGQDNDRHETP